MSPVGIASFGRGKKPSSAGGGPQTVTLRPNGIDNDSPDWSIVGGAASKWQSVSDDSNTTYILATDTSTVNMTFTLSTFAFGGANINSVTLRVKWRGNSNTGIEISTDASLGPFDDFIGSGDVSPVVETGQLRTEQPDGVTPWTQAAIDALVFDLTIFDYGGGGPPLSAQVMELYVDVVYTP